MRHTRARTTIRSILRMSSAFKGLSAQHSRSMIGVMTGLHSILTRRTRIMARISQHTSRTGRSPRRALALGQYGDADADPRIVAPPSARTRQVAQRRTLQHSVPWRTTNEHIDVQDDREKLCDFRLKGTLLL